jgi:hypothetical protein
MLKAPAIDTSVGDHAWSLFILPKIIERFDKNLLEQRFLKENILQNNSSEL